MKRFLEGHGGHDGDRNGGALHSCSEGAEPQGHAADACVTSERTRIYQ
jgi:hypothetical protein